MNMATVNGWSLQEDNDSESEDGHDFLTELSQDNWILESQDDPYTTLLMNGVQVARDKYTNFQRNAAHIKGDNECLLPKPIVIQVEINGVPVHALVDSGSLGDFISSTVVDQLKLKCTVLDKPLGL